MNVFYTHPDLVSRETLIIEQPELHHLTHVLRMGPGAEIEVTDGMGGYYFVTLELVEGKGARCRIRESKPGFHEPAVHMALAFPLMKQSSKFDLVVEKATELGVREIIPIVTERTIPRSGKLERWRQIALSATKQCRRAYCPVIAPVLQWRELMERFSDYSHRLVLYERQTAREPIPDPFANAFAPGNTVLFVVGPEGSFTEREIVEAENAGCVLVWLGPRRLRSETAALSAMSLASYFTRGEECRI
ncbi:MAG: 16S rRNA (uracil(1498)-N(3))-methyltransferase [Chlorobi bacterium]|nr:16S rRNA (uracil(1498)-N(3))-methyltransferase [Chlorobiota bacterium]